MATIPEALAMAIQHHQAGRLQAAEQIYRQILAVEPNQPDALHLLGVIASQVGKYDLAVDYIRRAIGLQGRTASYHTNLGGAYHALHKIPEAIACYRRALELKPDLAETHNNLGNALKEQGKLDEAVACCRRALALKPDYAEAHNNLGLVLTEQGKLDEAVACWCRALQLKPDYAEARNNLGVAFKAQGKPNEAVACWRRTLELKPDHAGAHNNLGVAFKDEGNLDEAVACWRRALQLKPEYAEACNNLGAVLKDQGKLDEAVVCFRRTLELNPDYAEAHGNLGNALKDQGKLAEAVACYRRAMTLRPDYAEPHYNLGVLFQAQVKLDDAIACYHRALELKPDYPEAQYNLGVVLKEQGKLDEAIACYRRALELKPEYAEAQCNLGNALKDQGKMDEALACFRGALELKPEYAEVHSNFLFALQYRTGVTLAQLGEAHAEYDRRHAAPLQAFIVPHENVRVSDGRLRLGFLSPNFSQHPVAFFVIRVLENLDQEQCEKFCYCNGTGKDAYTLRFQAAASQWRNVVRMSDQRLAEQIRADGIHVLFDLAGHTADGRLLVFARKPAPIQITWIGYEGTTGLAAMDYLLADRHLVPEGTDRNYREHVLRMPDGYVCYDPPAEAPPVGPLPSLNKGYATFGCFNNPAKITPQVVAVWAEILRRAPTARLLLKYLGLDGQTVKRRYLDLFAAHGVAPQRLELLPASSYSEYLATYHEVDVALDPFPFSGGATTCEALWMGVPVVTCPGETFAGRHSLSYLSSMGLTETVARDLDKYVELAVSLAGDLPRLASLRAGLRQRMAASPLCDGKRFADNLTSMLREVWKQRVGHGNDS